MMTSTGSAQASLPSLLSLRWKPVLADASAMVTSNGIGSSTTTTVVAPPSVQGIRRGSLGFTSPSSSTGGEVALLLFRVTEFSKVSTQLSKTKEFLGIYITECHRKRRFQTNHLAHDIWNG